MKNLVLSILLQIILIPRVLAQCPSNCNQSKGHTFLGNQAGLRSTNSATAQYNTFVGSQAGRDTDRGVRNSFFGYWAGLLNTAGSYNAFYGSHSGVYNQGSYNSFFGTQAGNRNEGFYNSFFGNAAGINNRAGRENAFFGASAGSSNSSGSQNAYFGYAAGGGDGERNTSIGARAGAGNRLGSGNVFLGYRAGENELGSDKLYIANSNTNAPLIYGDFSQQILNVNGSLKTGLPGDGNMLLLFNSERSWAFRQNGTGASTALELASIGGGGNKNFLINTTGFTGVGLSHPAHKVDVNGAVRACEFITRTKPELIRNTLPLDRTLEDIRRLEGLLIEYESADMDKSSKSAFFESPRLGLNAHEVQEAFPELVVADEEGNLSIHYDGFIPVLIEALKEQEENYQSEIARLQEEINLLKNALGIDKIATEQKVIPELYQNQPNPFDQNTQIKMYLPESVQEANLYLYNMQGEVLQIIPVAERGRTQIEIAGHTLNSGMYLYALIADNQEVDVKRMVLK